MSMSKFASPAHYWQDRAEKAEALLREIYEEHGPGSNGGRGKEPLERFAAMTKDAVDEIWDFNDRHLMHKIAQRLAKP